MNDTPVSFGYLAVKEAGLNPDPLRPVDTDSPVDDPGQLATASYGAVTLPVVPLVIALGVIVGILVAWAVR